MFKLFHAIGENYVEVLPINDIYTVKELGTYTFSYSSNIKIDNENIVFLEDVPIKQDFYHIVDKTLISKPNRYFEDYFGFSTLNINGEIFKINIQIEKLKLFEIEEILIFLWESENKVFENFISKSTIKSRISIDGTDYRLTSKFLSFANEFYQNFSNLYLKFKSSPSSILRKKNELLNYASYNVTPHAIDWLLSNFDKIHFDESFKGSPDAIVIEEKYGYIDKIETDKNVTIYSRYENQIILGAFKNLINKLKQMRSIINGNVDLNTEYGDNKYADFRDLKKIPYLKLFNECYSVESKLHKLYKKYKLIFKDTFPKTERPRLTSVFSNLPHYRIGYGLIKNLFEFKLNLNGELNFLNIKKLSQLYEVYNLHQIIASLSEKLNTNLFQISTTTNRVDQIINHVAFEYQSNKIEILYDFSYPNIQTDLIRINKSKSNFEHYRPDYILQFNLVNNTFLIVIDSKYSKFGTLKDKYLFECINKYILNTGFKKNRYKKVDGLILLYPGDSEYVISDNLDFSPHILILPSKPRKEKHLKEYFNKIIEKELPGHLHKTN